MEATGRISARLSENGWFALLLLAGRHPGTIRYIRAGHYTAGGQADRYPKNHSTALRVVKDNFQRARADVIFCVRAGDSTQNARGERGTRTLRWPLRVPAHLSVLVAQYSNVNARDGVACMRAWESEPGEYGTTQGEGGTTKSIEMRGLRTGPVINILSQYRVVHSNRARRYLDHQHQALSAFALLLRGSALTVTESF